MTEPAANNATVTPALAMARHWCDAMRATGNKMPYCGL